MISKIFLIRHGITEGNQKKWFYGASDLPLADEGVEAIKTLVADGKYPKFADDADYYTTGLIRTEQTLSHICGEVPHRTIANLQEMKFGDYECVSFEEVKDDEIFSKWGYDTTGEIVLPGGESQKMFGARVSEGLKELIGYHRLKELSHRHSKKTCHSVMVCHGGVISGIMGELFPEENKNIWDWIPDPGYGYIINFENGEIKNYEPLIEGEGSSDSALVPKDAQ